MGALNAMGRSAMSGIPWDAPATVMLFARGLSRQRADCTGAPLREAVKSVLSCRTGTEMVTSSAWTTSLGNGKDQR